MAAYTATIRWYGMRFLRSALAATISLSLAASLFHCCCYSDGGDEVTLTVSVAQSSSDDSGKTSSCSPGAHCCHCLAHVTIATPQDNIAGIEYVRRLDRVPASLAPDTADLDSPFKPPRA